MTQLQGINRLALSRLRPGDALESLRTGFGSKWKTPPRRWDGWVHGHDAGADFSARVDIRNVLGSVSFYGNFPKKYEIEGVALGADLQDVLHVQPQLEEDRERNPAFVAYVDETAGGIRRHFSFHRNKLVGITLERSRCEYPRSDVWMPAPDGFYPEPTGEPGAPFADGNLKLVVLDSLLSDKVIDLGTQQDLAMHVLGRYYDPNAEWGFVKEVYDGYREIKELFVARKSKSFLWQGAEYSGMLWILWGVHFAIVWSWILGNYAQMGLMGW